MRTIRARILGGLWLLITFATIESVLVLYIRQEEAVLQADVVRTATVIDNVTRVWRELAEVKANRRGYLLSGAETFTALIDRSLADSRIALEQLRLDMLSPAQGAQLEVLEGRFNDWTRRWPELTPGSGSADELVILTDERFQGVEEALRDFEAMEEVNLARQQADTDAVVRRATFAIVGIPVFAIFVMGGMLYAVRRGVLAPLTALAASARRIAGGEFPPLDSTDRPDEIGALANAMSVMTLAVQAREEDLKGEAARSMALAAQYADASAMAENTAAELRAIIDTVPVALMIMDGGGQGVRLQNEAATELLGREPVGADALEAFRARLRFVAKDGTVMPREHWPAQRALRGEPVDAEEIELHRADGSIVPLLVGAVPLPGDHGEIRAAVVALQDISRLRELDRMKDEFVAIVSHELRTPLTAIGGALQLVLDNAGAIADPESRNLLNIALENCGRLTRIINDILDISKMEAGRLGLHPRPSDVAEIIRVSLENIATQAEAARVTLRSDIARDLPLLQIDPDRVVQAVLNLVANAVKFSQAGSDVHVRATRQDDGVAIAVTDTGPGIPVEDLPRIFQKFQQLDSSAVRRKGGTGLGLAITKAIVEQHGGTVTVESCLGQGTTFTLVLPVVAGSRGGLA